jgi:hypothetical protein
VSPKQAEQVQIGGHLNPDSKASKVILLPAVRRIVLGLLSGAAGDVLLSREIVYADGRNLRWLRSDLTRFMGKLAVEAVSQRQIADRIELPSFGNRLMVELAVFTSAAYRVLLGEGVVPAMARQLVADTGWVVYARMLRLSSWPFRVVSRDPARRLRWTIRSLLRFPFSAPGAPGFAVETHLDGRDIVTYFTHCPPQSFVRALVGARGDRGDLEAFFASWCQYDWPGADIIAGDGERGHYARTQTLSRGDPQCDMCWKAKADPNVGEPTCASQPK